MINNGIRGLGTVLALLLCFTVLLTACGGGEEPPAPVAAPEPPPPHPWTLFSDAQAEARLEAHPTWAFSQGRHEFAGRLPDWSEGGIREEIARLRAARRDAEAFADADLTPEMRFQRDHLVARIDHDLFWLVKARWPFRSPQFYTGWLNDSLDPTPYLTQDDVPAEERMAAFARYLEAIPETGRLIRGNLRMPMPLTWLELGIATFSEYARVLRDEAPAAWAGVEDAALRQRLERANAQAIDTMTELAEWLDFGRNIADQSFALGLALYRDMLWETLRVRASLDDLLEAGRSDMERNMAELRNGCVVFAPGLDVPNCLAQLPDTPPGGDSPDVTGTPAMNTNAYLTRADLEAVPGDGVSPFESMPPEARVRAVSEALLSSARFLASISLHTDGWSVDDAKVFFMDEVFLSEEEAASEAARATYDPAFLSDTLHRLMIQRLREDWTAERGGRVAWPDFHDSFLELAGAPVPLVRQQMMGEPEPLTVLPEPVTVIAALPIIESTVDEVEDRQLNFAWDCEDTRYIVSSELPETLELQLFVDQEKRMLSRVRSASGVRYEGDDISFWNKGEEALLEVDGVETTCRLNRYQSDWVDADLREMDFRAVGHEPGWFVEIFSGRQSKLVIDDGETTLRFDASEPGVLEPGPGTVFTGTVQGLDVRVEFTPGPCLDSQVDVEYESDVVVNVGGRLLRGCGRALD